jgi:hypothetical protein
MQMEEKEMKLKAKMFFAWFDFWIGFYWDKEKRALFFAPLPCLVFKIKVRESELPPGMCKCGHRRDRHINSGCVERDPQYIVCPCLVPQHAIRPAGPPPRGILSEIGG